jgi:hypothetical protein
MDETLFSSGFRLEEKSVAQVPAVGDYMTRIRVIQEQQSGALTGNLRAVNGPESTQSSGFPEGRRTCLPGSSSL